VTAHVDEAAYFSRLHDLLAKLEAGDWLYLTDWRIDATRRLGPGHRARPLPGRGSRIGGWVWVGAGAAVEAGGEPAI
jgi:hypothetical protein